MRKLPFKCQHCGTEFFGKKKKYCSSSCRNKAYYARKDKTKEKTGYYKSRLYATRMRARRKGVDFKLSEEEIKSVVESPCEYCGKPAPSEIDRKTPSLGYVLENIVPACKRCNTLKNSDVTYDEMKQIADFLGWSK